MKKFILACGVAVMALATVSCSKTANNEVSAEDQAFADSLSEYIGTVRGAELAKSYDALDSLQKAKMDKDRILAGIKTVLLADTADQGYLAGLNIGMGLLQQTGFTQQANVRLDNKTIYEYFAKAFKADSVANLSDATSTLRGLMTQLQMKAMAAQQEAEAARRAEAGNSPEAKAALEAGKKYVADTKAADAAYKTTASGLTYKVVSDGKGETPKSGQTVAVKYTGRHIDGSVFDSSEGKAVEFPVDGVVPGFAEALKMMKPGAKYTVIIPADLAYGVDGTPDGSIKPNETLVFDIELDSVK